MVDLSGVEDLMSGNYLPRTAVGSVRRGVTVSVLHGSGKEIRVLGCLVFGMSWNFILNL